MIGSIVFAVAFVVIALVARDVFLRSLADQREAREGQRKNADIEAVKSNTTNTFNDVFAQISTVLRIQADLTTKQEKLEERVDHLSQREQLKALGKRTS